MAIRTIFTTVEDCSRDIYEGWCEFVRDYGLVARTLLSHYFPALGPDLDSSVKKVLAAARGGDNAWFRSLHFANEREFAMSFRGLVFDQGRAAARLPMPGIPADAVFALMEGLALVECELFWVFLRGWSVEQASAMLMNASVTAAETFKVTNERLGQIAPITERSGVTLLAIEAAQSRKTPYCLPLKVFNNVVNGQISWGDREDAERHIAGCVYCLENFTAFQEMIWIQKNSAPLGVERAEEMVAELGLQRPSRGLLGSFLRRAS